MLNYITVDKFDKEGFANLQVQKRKVGNPSTRNKVQYLDIITTFDIETTRIKEIEQSIMYVWAWHFGHFCTVLGRTWEEFFELCNIIQNNIIDGAKMVVFVHNLAYEFQFLKGVYNFDNDEVFALKVRKVLKCNMFDCLELRCSYIHSNMSLDAYTHKMGVEHVKLSGDDFDYTIERYPWTPLENDKIQYILHDVVGLFEAIEIEMTHDNDNLYTFPLTSTGYVRRDAKKAMRTVSHTFVKTQLPDYRVYKMLREAFRGGNTHANRYYVGKVLKGVKSVDIKSSYPAWQCNNMFPTSSFFHMGGSTFNDLMDLINIRKKAVIMRVSISNISLRDKYWGCPYIPRDKCRNIRNAIIDNGRILSASYLEITLTDIDLKIIVSEYNFDDFVAFEVAHARYGYLPPQLIRETIKYFEIKTTMKGVEGEELYYLKAKNKLNSIYGMMAQDPVKQSINFIDNEFTEAQDNPEELLTQHNKKAFLAYQWGVWVTAWARYNLELGIRLAGDNFIYCDTDSVKYINDVNWDEHNKLKIKDSKKSGAYAKDPSGKVHYMGVYEYEGEYHEFSTLGAKKYCYRMTPESELQITIAGVTKKKGGKELDAHGGIRAFKAGFVFKDAGGIEAVYNDNPEIKHYVVEDRVIDITSNVVLKESEYTLGISAEYEKLLLKSSKIFDI